MSEISNNLEDSDQVIVIIDKNNSFRSVNMKNMTTVNEHL